MGRPKTVPGGLGSRGNVLFVRADDALMEAVEKYRLARLAEGLDLSQAQVVRALIWKALGGRPKK